MNFISDNQSTVFPEIIDYLQYINKNSVDSYGNDPITIKANKLLSDLFESKICIRYVSSGTAANAISLSSICPPYGGILCSEHSHLDKDECGAPEFFSGGAKLIPMNSNNGLIAPTNLNKTLKNYGLHGIHEIKLSTLSLTQASELGTVYKVEQIRELTKIARENTLNIHMDGARFANACEFLNISPAEITWKSGIDILSLGATKNGAIACEIIIVFNKRIIDDIDRRQKRAGHLWSKNRYMAAQIIKWIENNNWLKAAKHSNKMAKSVKKILSSIKEIHIPYSVDANIIFAEIPSNIQKYLLKNNVKFSKWIGSNNLTRFVTSWDTDVNEINEFEKVIKSYRKI